MKFDDKKKSLEYLQGIFETASEGIFVVDADGHFLRYNPAFVKILGYKQNELKGKLFIEILHRKSSVKRTTSYSKLHHFHRSSKLPLEIELISKKGTSIPVRLHSRLIKNDKRKTVEAMGIIEDLRKDTGAKILTQEAWETQYTLHNVLANSGDAIMATDANGHITLVNEALLQMLGFKEDEVVGLHLTELSPYKGSFTVTTGDKITLGDEYMNYQVEKANELFKKGKVRNYELYWIRKDNKIVPIEATISVLKNQRGERKGSITICRDIGERKKEESELQEARDFLENIYKTSADGIMITHPGGVITMVNDAVVKMLGYSRDELLGKHSRELAPRGKRYEEKGEAFVTKLYEKGTLIGEDYTWQKKDGSLIDIEISIALLKDKGGTTRGSVATIRDVTERKRAEEALKHSEEKYYSLIETANDAIISTNKEGIITSFNKKAEEIYGYSREEIMGKSILTLFAPSEIARQQKGLEAFKKAKTFSPIETPMETINVRKNGQEFPVEASISSLEVHGEHIFTSFIRDITGRKNIEHTLLQSEKLRSLGELAGGVAHDFNNVLAAILGRVQLLRMQIGPPPEKAERRKATRDLRKSLEVIEKAALDGTETIRRIQEFSRKRDDDKHFADVDINKVIDDALEFTKVRWKDEAETRGITIHIKENLSPLAPIAGSAPELREVVTNLINNAIDAMPQGGEIRLKTLTDNGHVVIEIADTGSGIPHALADRIFDPFFTSKGPQSTGLGMSVSYGIINRHRGTINFNSVEGEGTTFTIKLPFSEQTFERKKITALRSKKQRKAKILVIEDEQDVLELLKDILTDNGHEVETASHGRQGLKMFREHHFDLVFTDLGMPEMSGWQVAKEVKKINKETPVALITGWEVQLDQSELKKSGVDLWVNKPFQVDEIRRLVDKGIDLQRKSKKTTKLTRNGKKKKTSARKNRNPGRK